MEMRPMTTFQLAGIDHRPFAPLFQLSDDELARQGITRCVADSDEGFPCRISLEDAVAGDELLLLHYLHQPADTPYRASGPIYVRRGQTRRVLAPGLVPEYVTRRLISVRAYDANHRMIEADVREGADVAAALAQLFTLPAVAYAHLHNARRGCFSCHVRRV
jgi:hypothetical protein